MALGKKTIDLVKRVLNSPKRRKLYSQEELTYMENQLKLLIEQRKRRKAIRRARKGFANDPFTSGGNTENFDD